MYFNLYSLTLVLSLGTTEKSPSPSALLPPDRYLYSLMDHPESSLF